MVQSAKDRIRNNASKPLDLPRVGRVLPERRVSTNFIIIGREARKNSPKVLSVENEQMISALSPDRADQAFNVSVLPRRAERRWSVPDPHCSQPSLERDPKCSVIVANEIFRCGIPRKRFSDLTRQPLRSRIAGHRKP